MEASKVTLMPHTLEASKVTLMPHTLEALNNPHLTPKKRRQLKEQAVIDLIRSTPSGTLIKTREIGRAIGVFKNISNVPRFLHNMKKRGLITMEPGPHKWAGYLYTVSADVKTTKPYAGDALGAKPSGNSGPPPAAAPDMPSPAGGRLDFTEAVNSLKAQGLEFTITISNKTGLTE